jgi:hypothetical protein
MITIYTKYHGPGNVRGSRISATYHLGFGDKPRRVVIQLDPEWDSGEGHRKAAEELLRRHYADCTIVAGGEGPRGDGCVFLAARRDRCRP